MNNLLTYSQACFTIILIFFCSCKFDYTVNINNIDISNFMSKKNIDFSDKKIMPYKANNAVVCPFFFGHSTNNFSFRCSVLAETSQFTSTIIHQYKIQYFNGTTWEEIVDKPALKSTFKKDMETTNAFTANNVINDNLTMDIRKTNQVNVQIDISVESKEKTERKVLNYIMFYEKLQFLPTR